MKKKNIMNKGRLQARIPPELFRQFKMILVYRNETTSEACINMMHPFVEAGLKEIKEDLLKKEE